jgi:LEA14-like dessication related protein
VINHRKNRKVLYAAAILAALVTGCQSLKLKMPEAALQSVNIKSISFTGAALEATVRINNPNGISIPSPRIEWELLVNDHSFVRGELPEGAAIKARASTDAVLPFQVDYQSLLASISSLASADESSYHLALSVVFNIPLLGEKRYTLEGSGVLPIPRLPSVTFKGIETRSLTLQRAEFVCTWEVNNPNGFSVTIDTFDYTLGVDNVPWASGVGPAGQTIAAHSTARLPVTVTFSAASLLRELIMASGRNSSMNYSAGGSMRFSFGLPGLIPQNMPLNLAGAVSL